MAANIEKMLLLIKCLFYTTSKAIYLELTQICLVIKVRGTLSFSFNENEFHEKGT